MSSIPPQPFASVRSAASFRSLFPDTVSVATSDGSDDPPPLMEIEAQAVSDAVPSRRREFALGRWCARRAMASLGRGDSAIPVGRRRAPIWPAGVIGSITHCTGFVGAAAASSDQLLAIGIDAELDAPLAPDLVPLVCTTREIEWLNGQPSTGVDWAKVIFSAKESIHKCIWPLCEETLDFLDLSLRIDPARLVFAVAETTAPPPSGLDLMSLKGRVAIAEPFVFTFVYANLNAGMRRS